MEIISKLDYIELSQNSIRQAHHRSPYAEKIAELFLRHYYRLSHRTAIYRMDYFTGFIAIHSPEEEITYLYGPFFTMAAEDIDRTDFVEKYHIRPHEKREFAEFVRSYPRFSPPLTIQAFVQLYEKHLDCTIALEQIDIIDYNRKGQHELQKYHEASIKKMDDKEHGKSYHNAEEIYKQQKMICSLIRKGDEHKLRSYLERSYLPLYQGVCDNHLVNQRNNALACIAIAVQAAIEGGLPADAAYRILDYYYFIICEESRIDSIFSYSANALYELAGNVAAYQYDEDLPPVIRQTLRYIQTNIESRITVSGISEKMHTNQTYLSRLFSEHMKQSLSAYIREKKVERARELLQMTDYSLSEIAELLNFSSQAHFQKVFKICTGISPKVYRDASRLERKNYE